MPAIVQVCAVLVTIAFVAVAIAAVRAMNRFEKASAEITRTAELARHSVEQVEEVFRDVRGISDSLGSVVPRFRSITTRFEDVGGRTASLSRTVMDEVEAPVRAAVAMVTGLRSGTARFFRTVTHRPPRHRSQTNGGVGHE